jgi:hypothetical protein
MLAASAVVAAAVAFPVVVTNPSGTPELVSNPYGNPPPPRSFATTDRNPVFEVG